MASIPATVSRTWKACVTGATGATGEQITLELLKSPLWSEVRTIGRRPLTIDPADESVKPFLSKLVQKTVDMEKLEEDPSLWAGCDASFCCIGTTRKDAGSAEAFRHVDLDFVAAAARACKKAGIQHFSYVSAGNASSSSWFLYPKTKGEAEDYLKAQGFPSLAIMQPGLLDRGAHARAVEKWASYVLPSIPVNSVAKAMRLHAEQVLSAGAGAGSAAGGAGGAATASSSSAGAGAGAAAAAVVTLSNSQIAKLANTGSL